MHQVRPQRPLRRPQAHCEWPPYPRNRERVQRVLAGAHECVLPPKTLMRAPGNPPISTPGGVLVWAGVAEHSRSFFSERSPEAITGDGSTNEGGVLRYR